jgi:hypothetical protein
MSEQRFIVNGINNDKIELVSNYDVRKFNRLIETTKDLINSKWKEKLKQAKEDIREQSFDTGNMNPMIAVFMVDVDAVLDELIKGDDE